jgi:hypothetical protein
LIWIDPVLYDQPGTGSRNQVESFMHWFCKNRSIPPVYAALTGWFSASQHAAPTWPSMGRRDCFMDYRPYDPRTREPRIRWELVQRIRNEIAAGTYETPEKLEKAVERLLERLERD